MRCSERGGLSTVFDIYSCSLHTEIFVIDLVYIVIRNSRTLHGLPCSVSFRREPRYDLITGVRIYIHMSCAVQKERCLRFILERVQKVG